MSQEQNIDLEKIKLLEKHLKRQKYTYRGLYAFSALMLADVVVALKTHSTSIMLVCGGMGWFDCFLADSIRKDYKQIRDKLKAYKDKQNEKSK